MSEANPLSDMTADEVRELLADEGAQVSDEQAALIARFVAQVGGLDEALSVLSELSATNQSRAA